MKTKSYINLVHFDANMADNEGLKQVILVRMDLKLPKGKLAAQVAHASVDAVSKTDRKLLDRWNEGGAKKVVLKAADEKELLALQQQARDAGMKSSLIADAGRTVLEPGTITCLGIGPDLESKIDKITGKLKVL
jgi:PTH2 family peptidyl-tRNA hydrolase